MMEQIPLDELRLMSVDDAEYIGALERQLLDLRSKTVWHDAVKEPPKEKGQYLMFLKWKFGTEREVGWYIPLTHQWVDNFQDDCTQSVIKWAYLFLEPPKEEE